MSGYGSGAPPPNITTVSSSEFAAEKGNLLAGNLSLHQQKALESIFGPGEGARVAREGVMGGLLNHEVRTEAERMRKLLNSRIGPGGAGEAGGGGRRTLNNKEGNGEEERDEEEEEY